MGRVLILIPCSKSKRKGGTPAYNASSSIINYLTSSSKEHLLRLRKRLFEYFSIQFGQDVDCQEHSYTINYTEAYKRYKGQIYRQISSSSWDKLIKNPGLDLVIVSALYGLLRYDEPIQYYDMSMKNKIGHRTLKTWWRKNGLCAILKDYIYRNNISEIHNVLSNDYNEAIRDCFEDMQPSYLFHDFREYRSGSNAHRGKWVNDFIKNFIDCRSNPIRLGAYSENLRLS